MKTSTKSVSYKLYENGTQFLLENEKILNKNVNTKIITAFFSLNARLYKSLDYRNYAFQFSCGEEKLVLLKCEPYNALLFGSKKLAVYAADIVASHNLEVSHLLGEQETTNAFLTAYTKRMGGEIQMELSMQIMVLNNLIDTDTKDVFTCGPKDLDGLARCYHSFDQVFFHKTESLAEVKEKLQGHEASFFAYAVEGNIVSIASKIRGGDEICAISHVYTIPKYRGKGYARKVVAGVCKSILKENKVPYLFVDNTNPISNHLYLTLGFQYLINQTQYLYLPDKKH